MKCVIAGFRGVMGVLRFMVAGLQPNEAAIQRDWVVAGITEEIDHQTLVAASPREYQAATARKCLSPNLPPSMRQQPIAIADSPKTPPTH